MLVPQALDSSSELETNLFSGEDVLADDIGFQFCVFGSWRNIHYCRRKSDG